MNSLPIIKKKIGSFFVKEEGKITKESLIKSASLITAVAVGMAMGAKDTQGASACTHSNDITLVPKAGVTAMGTHNHHCSHSSHGSHGSHCSWMC
jgi:hypothetical protein